MTGLPPGCSVRFSRHALSRYQERVRPTLERTLIAAELERASQAGAVQSAEPGWLAGRAKTDRDFYLLLGEDVVFPLVAALGGDELVAVTCLARGGLSEASRAHRNQRRRAGSRRRRR